ncbi:hypothetical protein ACQZV8_14485 [Magnetococcales bacterium HHB-1]
MGGKTEQDEGTRFRCPVCGGRPARIFQCNMCGEVRCGQSTCTGSKRMNRGWAGQGSQCRSCGEGRYMVLDFFSKKMEKFLRQWQRLQAEKKAKERMLAAKKKKEKGTE